MTGREYSQRLLQYFEDMINAQVTQSIYYPRDFRGTRGPGPAPYDGTADIDEFERWLVQPLKFYQSGKMCGRRADFLRVIHVGQYLSGEASEWYEAKVYSVNRDPTIRWTFIEVIRHLFHTFIDESALQLAVQSYYRVRYSESKGVLSYIRELERKAGRLTSRPNEFTFRERFVEGLPERIVDKMIERYDITAEGSTIEQMTTAIRQIEKSSTYGKRIKERRRIHRSHESPDPAHREKAWDRLGKTNSRRRSRSRERRKSHRKEKRTHDQDRPNRDDTRRERKFEPDQDAIRHAVAKARYRSKCDISNAYELIWVEPGDVWKTTFATIYGTFVSNVMQQGDCNAPSTFQRFVTHLFREHIGKFVHIYLDNIFIFSDTIEDHERHLRIIMDILHNAEMTLNPRKYDFYSK